MTRTVAPLGLVLALLLLTPPVSAFASDDAGAIRGLVQQIERLQAEIDTATPADSTTATPLTDAAKAAATLENWNASSRHCAQTRISRSRMPTAWMPSRRSRPSIG
jgi:hypothetical protein